MVRRTTHAAALARVVGALVAGALVAGAFVGGALVGGLGLGAAAIANSPQTALLRAQAEARGAQSRVRALEARADAATTRINRTRAALAAAVARIAAAEAGISAAEARVRIVDERRAAQRVRLAAEERPAVMLVAGLQTLARRPPALALVQPGSLQDLVHTRALLASTMPAIAARTAGMRAELALAERIERQSVAAAASLRARRADLDTERRRLAALEARGLARRQVFVDAALGEGDRVLALGEDARAIVSQSQQRRDDAAVVAVLARLPGPSLRPGSRIGAPPSSGRPRYLMPVAGRLLVGAGEISAAGVHARGLTLATAENAPVIAPADGRVVYAGPFRSFGYIAIVDHGGGWTTLVTDLAALDVSFGDTVDRGEALGRAASRRPQVTIELRRGGRPVPITPLL